MSGYRIPSDYRNDVPKSNHNWFAPVGGTVHPGLVYPEHHRHLNVGDRVRGNIESLVQSQPMQGPLLGSFKRVTIATFMPDSVLYGWLRNGIRYSPQKYQEFSYWRFNGTEANKGFDEQTWPYITPLSCGLPKLHDGTDQVNGDTLHQYRSWVSDGCLQYDKPIPDGAAGKNMFTFNHIGRGGLWEWLGAPAGAVPPVLSKDGTTLEMPESFSWRIESAVCYFLSYYYYFANMQEDKFYYTRSLYNIEAKDYTASTGSDGSFVAHGGQYPFERIFEEFNPDDFIRSISSLNFYSLDGATEDLTTYCRSLTSDGYVDSFLHWLYEGLGGHGGLFPAPYSPDLFNNIIKMGESPTAFIEVDTDSGSGDQVAVPQLRLQTKIQNMLDRLFVSGGRPGDVFRTLWGTKSSPETNKPEFLGIWVSTVTPSNVVATAAGSTDTDASSVGQMAARVDRWSDFKRSKKIDYYATEPGTLMFLTVLIPMPSYCQGLHPDLSGAMFADEFNPELKGIGFLSVPRHRYSMLPESFTADNWTRFYDQDRYAVSSIDPNMVSVGDEAAFSWLRTDYGRLHGEFSTNGYYQYWTLVRRFTETFSNIEKIGGDDSENVTKYYNPEYVGSYVNPMSWQYLFVGQGLADANFTLLTNLSLTVTSSVPKNYMPYLGR